MRGKNAIFGLKLELWYKNKDLIDVFVRLAVTSQSLIQQIDILVIVEVTCLRESEIFFH